MNDTTASPDEFAHPPFIRGESEPVWHPCPPSPVGAFRCRAVYPTVGRCGRWRWHKDHHWAPNIDWHDTPVRHQGGA